MLYLFHGSDQGKSRGAFAQFLHEGADSQPISLTGDKLDLNQLSSLFYSPPLLCERILIAIEGYPQKAVVGPILGLLESLPNYLDVAFWVGDKLKNTDSLYQLSARVGEVYVFNSSGEESIFRFLDLLSSKRKTQAQLELESLLSRGLDAYYIFSMILWQWRNLLTVIFNGPSSSRLHPFVKKKIHDNLKNWSPEALLLVHKKLLEYELWFKTGQMSKDLFIRSVVGAIFTSDVKEISKG